MGELVQKAYSYAKEKHAGQLDDERKDYFEAHLCPVAEVIKIMTTDEEVIAAAYLHDTLEDTDTSYFDLCNIFGDRVAQLVNEVTHEGCKDNYGYYFPRLKSREAIMIKLADRLSNISRMQTWDDKRKQQYLKRTKFWKDGS